MNSQMKSMFSHTILVGLIFTLLACALFLWQKRLTSVSFSGSELLEICCPQQNERMGNTEYSNSSYIQSALSHSVKLNRPLGNHWLVQYFGFSLLAYTQLFGIYFWDNHHTVKLSFGKKTLNDGFSHTGRVWKAIDMAA